MSKFCCDKFRLFYSGEKTMGLNIRVVKLSKEFMMRSGIDFDKVYWITEGYSGSISDCIKKMNISYCPFCGKELRRLYHSEDYVQEIVYTPSESPSQNS